MNKMYMFYEENGDPSDFELVNEYLTRINAVIDSDTEKLFMPKDTHFFIALFDEFAGMDLPDEEFNNFLRVFIANGLGNVVVEENCSFNEMVTVNAKTGKLINYRSTMATKFINIKSDILHKHFTDFINGDFDGTDTVECA